MKSKIYAAITIALCIAAQGVKAQNTFPSSGKVGIGTLSPDASSLLEIRSTSKGFLTPRMTQTQRNAISGPATGLMVYVTDVNPGFYFYSGSGWVGLVAKNKGWLTTGNSSLDSASNFIGTTDNGPFSIRTNNVERVHVSSIGNVGIGVTSPAALLHINGGGSASLTTNGYVLLGKTNNYNLAMDNQQIQSRYNGSYSSLYLNQYGGTVYAGNSSNSYYGLIAYGSTYGVYGSGSSYGMYGYASSGTGVYGYGTSDGLYGSTSSGSGVYGYADGADNSGGGYGGYFYNSSGKGVEGYDGGTGHGVYGYETGNGEGVDGFAYGTDGWGVEAYSSSSYGLYASTGTGTYAAYFGGSTLSSGNYITSDEKLKQNITDMSSAMDIINQLKPKNYNFRQDGSYAKMNLPQGKHYGLIAQDVEKILPGLVKDTKFDAARATHAPEKAIDSAHNAKLAKPAVAQAGEEVDFKAVNYTELIPIMIKAMQEQQDVITKLQQQLTALQQTVGVNPAAAVKTIAISSAALLQNTPNPYNSSTTIQYNLPAKFSSAKIVVTDNNGAMLKQINLSGQGKGAVNLDASSMASGNYNYSLFIDGQLIDSKRMILSR